MKLLVFILMIPIVAKTQYFEWGLSYDLQLSLGLKTVDVDASNNLYTGGSYQGSTDLDPSPGVFMSTSTGGHDIFITRFDSNGNLVWALSLGGLDNEYCSGLKCNPNGEIIITGSFRSSVDFDPGPGVFQLTQTGTNSSDMFILKLDSLGNFINVWHIESTSPSYTFVSPNKIETDLAGNMFFLGKFSGIADFDASSGTHLLTASALDNWFLLKMDNVGNFNWVLLPGEGKGYAWDLDVDVLGDVYVGGAFAGGTDFDPGPGIYPLWSTSSTIKNDAYIVKFTGSGNFVWVKQIGGSEWDYISGLNVDNLGNIYLSGFFEETCDMDPGAAIVNMNSAGGRDGFLVKLNSSGNFLWAKQMTGYLDQNPGPLQTDSNNNVYWVGYSQQAGTIFPLHTTPKGIYDVFIAKIDADGNLIWLQTVGGGFSQTASAHFVVAPNDRIYLRGALSNIVDIDPHSGVYNMGQPFINSSFIMVWGQDTCSDINLILDSFSGEAKCSGPAYANYHVINGLPPVSYFWDLLSDTIPNVSFTIGGVYTIMAIASNGCSVSESINITSPVYYSGYELQYNLNGSLFEYFHTSTLKITVQNNGCDTVPAVLTLVLDTLSSFSEATPYPQLVSGDTLQWNFYALSYDSGAINIYVDLQVDTFAMIGDTICLDVLLEPILGDIDTNNNKGIHCFVVQDDIGIENNLEEFTIKTRIFPNPSSDFIIVEANDFVPDKIFVTDLWGRGIKSLFPNGNKTKVDLTSFEKGVYFITVLSGENKITMKTIKQ